MMNCTSDTRLSLATLLALPATELRLMGAEDDPKTAEPDAGSEEEDDKDDKSKKSGEDDDKKDEPKAEPDAKDRKIAALEEEKERHYEKRQEAETKVKELENRIKELEKSGTTDETTKQRLETLETETKTLTGRVTDLSLENAFLKDNTYKWKNPSAALKLADLSKVEIDDKGVHGLASALEKLAKSDPYLLDTEEPEPKKPAPKKSGEQPASKSQQDEKSRQATEAKLKAQYPGLRTGR